MGTGAEKSRSGVGQIREGWAEKSRSWVGICTDILWKENWGFGREGKVCEREGKVWGREGKWGGLRKG